MSAAAAIAAIIDAAAKIYTAYNAKEENRRQFAQLSSILSQANSELISQMEIVIGSALNKDKKDYCTDRLQSLSTFFLEYKNNPLDIDKLRCIDQEPQFLLNRLDNPEDSLPAIHTFIGTATLRIDALALKSEFEPGDKVNAIELAKRSIEYAKQARSLMLENIDKRVTVTYKQFFMLHPDRHEGSFKYCRVEGVLKRDSKTVKKTIWDTEDRGQDYNMNRYGFWGSDLPLSKKRCLDDGTHAISGDLESRKISIASEIIKELPLSVIDQCIESWSAFASA
jgi:hypothetical protein